MLGLGTLATVRITKLVGEKTKSHIEGVAALRLETDLVVVKISGGCLPALSLGNSDAVQVSDSVYAVRESPRPK